MLRAFLLLMLTACQPSLEHQPRLNPYADPRPQVAGTVPFLKEEEAPPKLTHALLERGRERYDIFCSVCHGFTGYGNGMAVARGFPKPESFHSPENQKKNAENFYTVIRNGKGKMADFAHRISPNDRWAIAYYLKALQVNQRERK